MAKAKDAVSDEASAVVGIVTTLELYDNEAQTRILRAVANLFDGNGWWIETND